MGLSQTLQQGAQGVESFGKKLTIGSVIASLAFDVLNANTLQSIANLGISLGVPTWILGYLGKKIKTGRSVSSG